MQRASLLLFFVATSRLAAFNSAATAQPSVEDDWRALVALYNDTNGPAWNRNDNWSSSTNSVPGAVELDSWYGVTVTDGRVTGLSLSGNALSGAVSPELGTMSNLKELLLGWNSLTGELPHELGKLSQLEWLGLDHNKLVGNIPPELGKLSQLTRLTLSANALTGSIPPELGSLSRLELLELDANRLTGEIPAKLGDLSQLIELYLGENELRGEIPPELGSLFQLVALALGNNSLTGSIPPALGNLSRLVTLKLGQNALIGPIPAELGNLAQLDDLWLPINALTGEIPPELGSLANLRRLDVRTNKLSGEIPPELGNLGRLEWLLLSFNNLTGQMPDELGSLSQLRRLAVRSNNLSGPLPIGLTDLTRLEQLAIHDNSFCVPFEERFQAWLGGVRNLDFSPSPKCAVSTVDLLALVKFYNATDGPNWTRNRNWSATAPVLTEAQLDQWYGVTVSERRVTELILRGNGLKGALPPELGNLTQLLRLHLDRNALRGSVPPELGNLSQLEHLQLDNNALTGEIPAELGSLPKLLRLHLDHNALTGEIPVALADLSELSWLSLDHNALGGELPMDLGSLPQLKRLQLDHNALTGHIPPELAELSELLWLRLSHNTLSGDIPPELGHLTELEWLDVSRNGFTGKLPHTMTQLGRLGYLFFQGNDGLCAPTDDAFQSWLENVFAHLGPSCQGSVTFVLERNWIADGEGTYSVTLTGVLAEPVANRTEVPLTLSSGTVLHPSEFASSAPMVLAIPAGDRSASSSFTVLPYPDTGSGDYQMATLTATTAPQGINIDPSGMMISLIDDGQLLWTDTIGDQTYARNLSSPILELPEATNGIPPVAYALSPELPPGLFFDERTRTVTGTPSVVTSEKTYTYSATDAAGYAVGIEFTIEVVGVQDTGGPEMPSDLVLQGNFPNPFSESTHIEFDLPRSAQVSVELINLLGHRVAVLPAAWVDRGWKRRIEVSGLDLPSGVYLYRLLAQAGPERLVRTGRFTLVR